MNYTGTGRSNYFSVTNKEILTIIAKTYNLTLKENENGDFCLLSSSDDGSAASCVYVDDDVSFDELEEAGITPPVDINDRQEEVELPELSTVILPILSDDDVFIWTAVGSEGHRYLNGHSTAYNKQGEAISINLSDIEQLVKDKWGTYPKPSEY